MFWNSFNRLFLLTLCLIFVQLHQLIAQQVIRPIKEAEANNFRYQTSQGKFHIGSSFGLGLGIQSSSTSVAEASLLVDGVSNTRVGYFPINRLLVGANIEFAGSMAIAAEAAHDESTNYLVIFFQS